MSLTEKKSWVLSEFDNFEKDLNGEASGPLHTHRKSAIARFAEIEFPGPKNEEWKYTPVPAMINENYLMATPGRLKTIDSQPLLDIFEHRLVFVNGFYDRALSSSLPAGVSVEPLEKRTDLLDRHLDLHLKRDENAFVFLNHAFVRAGICVSVKAHAVVDSPVHILHVDVSGQPQIAQPFVILDIGENAQVTFFESSTNSAGTPTLLNSVVYGHIGQSASVHYTKLQNDGLTRHRIDAMTFEQESASRLVSTTVTLGSARTRNLVTLHLNGEHIESTMNGLFAVAGTQHIDNRTVIHHAKPNCASHELYKGILDDKSTGVFNGKILVYQDAQKTDAKQSNGNILLSPEATMNTKPQLEIFADDVKCTHGATIGFLDDKALFYMRSRGIPLRDARAVLTHAFAYDVISRVNNETLRSRLDNLLVEKLHRMKESS